VEHFVDRDEMTGIHHVSTVEVSGTPYESKLAAPFLYERVTVFDKLFWIFAQRFWHGWKQAFNASR